MARKDMATEYLDPTYRMWLAGEIAAGRVSAPGWLDPIRKAAWCAGRWAGPPMPNIDPSKTADADMKYISIGAQTLDRTARNHNGSSGQANRMKLAKELRELPSTPWGGGDNSANGSSSKRDEDDD